MPNGLTGLIERLSTSSSSSNDKAIAEKIRKINEYLLGLNEIRILIGDSRNFGHQSSSVNILRNLIRMGATAKFTIALYNDDRSVRELVEKIKLLIPQFRDLATPFRLDGRMVEVIELNSKLPKGPLAITGGWDEHKEVPNDTLNVLNYVQLQPYAWDKGIDLIILERDLDNQFNLDKKFPELALRRRAFYLPEPTVTADDWASIRTTEFKEKANIVKWVVDNLSNLNIHMVPVYGIATIGLPWASLYNIVAGILAAQADKTLPEAGKPTVVLVIAELSNTDWEDFSNLVLLGGSSSGAELSGKRLSPDFVAWNRENQVSKRAKFLWKPGGGLSQSEVIGPVQTLKNNEVLAIQLGKIPAVLFNHLYAKATLPPVFEGQNTSELMLNLGRPYFKIGSNVSAVRFGYPTLPLDSETDGVDATSCQAATYNGIYDARPDSWYAERQTYPPRVLLPIIRAYLSADSKASFVQYFASLGKFYHGERRDKLLRAFDLLVNVIKPIQTDVTGVLIGPASPVEQLYNDIKEHIQDGVLDLLEALASDWLNAFFKEVITDGVFRISGADLQINSAKTEVTLNGTTSAFGVGNTTLCFTFTEGQGAIKSELAATFGELTMAFPGAQWLAFSKPGLMLTLDENAAVPVTGAFTAEVTAGFTMEVAIALPSEKGDMLLQGNFTQTRPSFSNLFQMVGGINLQSILPDQLQLITDIEVQNFELRYNYADDTMEYAAVNLGTPAEPPSTWSLVPAVDVKGLQLNATSISPGKLSERKTSYRIGGQFDIAGATAFINAQLPQLRVTGGLTEDSKPLVVAAIIKAYLGDDFVQVLPASIRNTEIDRLNFFVDKALGAYSFAMDVKADWAIEIDSKAVFTVTGLGLSIEAISTDIDPDPKTAQRRLLGEPPRQGTNGASKATREITGSFNGTTVILPDSANIGLSVSAIYGGKDKGWTFNGKTTTAIELGKLLSAPPFNFDIGSQRYQIDNLSLTITTADNSWVFDGSISNWKIEFLGLEIKTASLKAGYNGKQSNVLVLLDGSTAALLIAENADRGGYFANLEVDVTWQGIDITAWIKFSQGKNPDWGFTFAFTETIKLKTTVEQNDKQEWIGTLGFTDDVTIGALIETMVSWITGSKFGLEAPWNVLDSISLSGLQLEYNFTTKSVSFIVNIGPIDLGIARIDSIKVNYLSGQQKPEDDGVQVTLKGSFPWTVGQGSKGDTLGPWNAAEPGAAPAPPGQGNKYVDLRLLALGQHVTSDCFRQATTVQAAIDCMKKLPAPPGADKPPEIPNVQFDADSSWLIGADFGILKVEDKKNGDLSAGESRLILPRNPETLSEAVAEYVLNLQVVFNDPHLYGLRVAMAGEAAKIFQGLDFQIMYQQVSETVGVYRSVITLPDAMRHLTVGAYSVTLPVFGIEVYTNGDFQIDAGFPWNENFTRSFSIEGILPPGIPVMGSAGFYFGKLSSASTNKVPVSVKGTFNPVIVFGFGMQIGFGKSVQYGVLNAGFSVTIVGIIEGVIGKWNPYPNDPLRLANNALAESNSQIQGAYYFWLRGTVGLMGKLYGTIDFAIIKADINVEIKLVLQLTYESYVSITMTVIASVDVSVSITINLGLFRISIDFSFSMRLKETFTIDNHGIAPWADPQPSHAETLLRAPADRRLRSRREIAARVARTLLERPATNWANLEKAATAARLSGYLAPSLTLAQDEWGDGSQSLKDQVPCYVMMLFIDSVPSASRDTHTSALKAVGRENDTPFEILCKTVLRWAIAAIGSGPVAAENVDNLVIGDEDLVYLIEEVLISTDANPTPIPECAIERFLTEQFQMTVKSPPLDTNAEAPCTFFPMAPALKLEIPNPVLISGPVYNYIFADYNEIDDAGLVFLRTYFDKLAVKVQQKTAIDAKLDGKKLSMAGWIMTDYFLLLARHMVQAARDALRDFKFPIEDPSDARYPDTPDGIVTWINENGKTAAYTRHDLFAANATHELNPGKAMTIGVTYPIEKDATSFERAAAKADLNEAISAGDLATVAAADTGILHAGTVIAYGDTRTYTVQAGDSMLSIARHFKVPFSSGLLVSTDVLKKDGLLKQGESLVIPEVTCQALTTDTFDSIAGQAIYAGRFNSRDLAKQNAGRSILRAGVKIGYQDVAEPYVVQPTDCLGDVATHFDVSLDDLLDPGRSSVLTQRGLLAPVAVLVLPTMRYETGKGDTIDSVAAKFAMSPDVLGIQPANGDIRSLFATAKANGQPTPYLDVPHLTQFTVKYLIAEAQRSLALQHLSGMASRYYLHGMRLPTHNDKAQPLIRPMRVGMWVKRDGEKLTLPPSAGLYALTGQQVPLPATRPFTITLDRSGGPEWLLFEKDNASSKTSSNTLSNTLSFEIKSDSPDAMRIQKVTEYGHANRLDTGLTVLGAEPMYDSELVTYPLTSTLVWQSADAVTLPYGEVPSGSPALRLWKLPDAMVNLPDLNSRKINPRFNIQVGRYDETTGGTIKSPVDYYGWASTIEFTIKKIPAADGSHATKSTYEIIGAGGNDIVLMERLLDQVKDDDRFFAQLILGYPPVQTGDATQGLQTDPVASVTVGIAQVNLSTETRPPSSGSQALVESGDQGLLNKKSEFIRLLWEASITRAGGFFLYYYNSSENGGLPDRIFNDKGEARVTLVVLYTRPSEETAQNRLTDFMNAVATGLRIDTSNAVVFAQAAPCPVQIRSSGKESLASIAYDYYSNVGDLAASNAALALVGGTKVKVSEGLYQVTPNTPGGDLDRIAAHFSLGSDGVQQIKNANPRRTDWHEPLPLYTAIRLPQIDVSVGTSPGGTSLSSIAIFYGENLTALAAHNQHVAFADGSPVNIPGGPRVRSATVPPGVEAVTAVRPVPAVTPSDPNAENFARDFLQNTYSLLNYQVIDNVEFTSSNMGLPAGPTTGTADPENNDKIRMPRVLEPVKDSWHYKQAIPYPHYFKPKAKPELSLIGGLPEDPSPFAGIGSILQVNFTWQDYYGNTLVTDLSDPQEGDTKPINQPPLLTGYADALIGLSQWPSVAASWQVVGPAGKPRLEVLLSFDDSRYQGLLMAEATGAATVVATFTKALDKTSAEDKSNYTVNGVAVNSALLEDDERTVTLTLNLNDSLKDENALRAKDIKRKSAPSEGETVFDGRAGFSYPQAREKRSSTVQENAEKDLRVYTRLFHQLADQNGITYSIESSLLKEGSFPVQDDKPLIDWLFAGSGSSSSIYQFIADRGSFGLEVQPPTPQLRFTNDLELDQVNDSQIFVLSLSFIIRRTGGAVLGDLETTPGIRQTATQVAPLSAKLDANDQKPNTLGLSRFATNFEAACRQPGVYQLKVATGVDRTVLASARHGMALWAVRLGLNSDEGISYSIGNQGKPVLFAPRPISNTLVSKTGVAIYDYKTGTGISPTPTRTIDFADIDMDVWGSLFLRAIDGVLSPEYTAAIQLVDKWKGTDYLADILAQKKLLACIVSQWMIPVFDGETADPTSAQEAFYQQLLARLSNAYTTRAAIEFKANVQADINDALAPNDAGKAAGPRFEAAALDTGGLWGGCQTRVHLQFSNPMDKAAAEDKKNYTVPDGLMVQKASLSLDGLWVTLSVLGVTTASDLAVTASARLKDTASQTLQPPFTQTVKIPPIPPRLFGNVIQNELGHAAAPQSALKTQAEGQISLTSPKLALRTRTGEPLTFLLTAPDTVKSGGGEVVPFVTLDLTYDGSNIEHQITTVPGIQGYLASSWLHFLISEEASPLTQKLGKFDVPMVLRAFPTSPTMTDQLGTPTGADGTLSELTQWTYSFTYALPFHYPQDFVYCEVEFNIKAPDLAVRDFEDAFHQLAQFVTVFPEVKKDFEEVVSKIDATTDDKTKIDEAAIAVESFLAMVTNVQKVASGGPGLTMAERRRDFVDNSTLTFNCYIQEGSITYEGEDDVLMVAIIVTKPGAIDIKKMPPVVEIEGYDSLLHQGTDCGEKQHDGEQSFCYVYKKKDLNGERAGHSPNGGLYLSAKDGQSIAKRQVKLLGLDILQSQDARSTVYINRNELLIPGKPTAEKFVYKTAEVQFANPLHPTIDTSKKVNIAEIPSHSPAHRSLKEHLNALLDALLLNNTQERVTFQVETTYSYSVNPILSPVPLPLLMQAPLDVQVVGKTQPPSRDQMVADWSAAIGHWFTCHRPAGTEGTLRFDLTIMSNLTKQAMPLLRLRDLELPIAFITPPLDIA